MFINFLMNYYLYTNFGKNIYYKNLKTILEKIYTIKIWKKNFQ